MVFMLGLPVDSYLSDLTKTLQISVSLHNKGDVLKL